MATVHRVKVATARWVTWPGRANSRPRFQTCVCLCHNVRLSVCEDRCFWEQCVVCVFILVLWLEYPHLYTANQWGKREGKWRKSIAAGFSRCIGILYAGDRKLNEKPPTRLKGSFRRRTIQFTGESCGHLNSSLVSAGFTNITFQSVWTVGFDRYGEMQGT